MVQNLDRCGGSNNSIANLRLAHNFINARDAQSQIQNWRLSFLLYVHLLVGLIKHFIQRLAFMPFGRTDTDAYPKAVEMACVIPLVKLLMNAFNDFFCSARGRV